MYMNWLLLISSNIKLNSLYSNFLLFNNTFQLVKFCFPNAAATLHSSIKLEQLVNLVKRISAQDLYNQTNVQLEKWAVASEHHGDNETEGIKPMEFHIKADDEDAAESNQVGIAVSRPSRARQLTENRRKYHAELVLEKRTKAMTRLQRKAIAIDDLLYSGTNHVTMKEELG